MRTIKHLRWWIVGLLFLATVINYLSRQTLSVLQPVIQKEFDLTNTDYSHIVFAFTHSYVHATNSAGSRPARHAAGMTPSSPVVGASILRTGAGSARNSPSGGSYSEQARRATGRAQSGDLRWLAERALPPAFQQRSRRALVAP
jgi:hypothetical protein